MLEMPKVLSHAKQILILAILYIYLLVKSTYQPKSVIGAQFITPLWLLVSHPDTSKQGTVSQGKLHC